jgi:hypothetical protein
VSWDPAVLTAVAVHKTPITAEFGLASNLGTAGLAVISLYGSDALTGSGPIVEIEFSVIGAPGASTAVHLEQGQIDEGRITSCLDDGAVAVCPSPSAETCNGIDDDCDGSIDEELGTLTCGVGACVRTVDACVGGVPQVCEPGTPAADDGLCNAIDDDCDGATDEDYAPLPTTCGVGACASNGTTSCVGGSVIDDCVSGLPGDETCNGLDDDCDGTPDENGAAMCADGDTCNGEETCGGVAGCRAGTPPVVGSSISIPDTVTGGSGGTVSVPVLAQPAGGIGVDLTLTYDPAVLRPTSVLRSVITQEATLTSNLAVPGEVRISIFSATVLSGAGPLAFVEFAVVGPAGSASSLNLTRADIDEGAITTCTSPGGFVACAEPNGVVDGLTVDGKASTTIAWSPLGAGTRYDVATGSLLALQSDRSAIAAGCLSNDLSTASALDARGAPAVGDGYYYIVRPQTACANGSYGTGTPGGERWPAAACP